jgi:NADH/NAD ratio-sensing transcriptional regulator Rex
MKNVRDQVIKFLAEYSSMYIEDEKSSVVRDDFEYIMINGNRGYKYYTNKELLDAVNDYVGEYGSISIEDLDEKEAEMLREFEAMVAIDSKLE